MPKRVEGIAVPLDDDAGAMLSDNAFVVVWAGAEESFADAAEEEHLIVHGQAEEDGEQHHRAERRDRLLRDTDDRRAPAPFVCRGLAHR